MSSYIIGQFEFNSEQSVFRWCCCFFLFSLLYWAPKCTFVLVWDVGAVCSSSECHKTLKELFWRAVGCERKLKSRLYNCGHKEQSLKHTQSSQLDLISPSSVVLRAVYTIYPFLGLKYFVLTTFLQFIPYLFMLSVSIFFIGIILAYSLPCCIITSHLALPSGLLQQQVAYGFCFLPLYSLSSTHTNL